ncbi:hypothetical protein D6D13_06503 [Aureobasidium pullulans]|uniref:CENP-V/GFA domain-containing protein n=1 Tax=Aureobasidium pullulans TaxID=5580 RepID=A0A4S9CH92_AURPU|nr:hypothetical protein D6D13_06503 [Aureobasidium pullulans]
MVQTATATCFCGTVRLELPVEGPDFLFAFVCHCTDCRKLTSSMFTSGFAVNNTAMKHVRGEEKLSKYSQKKTIESGNYMTDFFCSVCGTLMYRRSSGYPEMSLPRIGTVDDFELHETKLEPQLEVFCKNRVSWFNGVEGAKQSQGGQ